jgi:eukaryotic-like serine/threonine-protein kinase
MASGPLEPGQLIEDTYRIVRRIGEGGMGEVFEATHARLAGRYALKVLLREIASDANLLARFQREAQVTSALRHPNIVQVVDFRQLPDGTSYIVMEFLEGRDLADELRRCGAMPLERVATLVDQIASGLAAAHQQGVVHRDLKPANLFLVVLAGSGRELLKIVDFGISKVRAKSGQITRTATVIGTPQYMSPEQALGQSDRIDARSDQFSLASIVYEMVVGRCAFDGDSVPALMYQLVHVDPPPMMVNGRPVSPAIEAVVRRGLAKQAQARYPDVLAFTQDFAAAVAGRPLTSSDPAPAQLISSPGRTQMVAPDADPRSQSGGSATRRLPEPGRRDATLDAAPAQITHRTGGRPPSGHRVGRALATVAGIGIAAAVAFVLVTRPAPLFPPRADREITPTPEGAPTAERAALPERRPPPERPSRARDPERVSAGSAGGAIPSDEVSIDVQDPPANLTVAVDGGAPRPVPARLGKGSGTHLLVFQAPGYRPHPLRLDAVRDLSLVLSLKKLGARGKEARGRATANNNGAHGDRAEEAPQAAPVEPRPKRRSSAITDL